VLLNLGVRPGDVDAYVQEITSQVALPFVAPAMPTSSDSTCGGIVTNEANGPMHVYRSQGVGAAIRRAQARKVLGGTSADSAKPRPPRTGLPPLRFARGAERPGSP
jgi:hypothetical protein